MSFDPSQLALLPNKPGVYQMKDASGTIIYVGKAKKIRQRVQHYFAAGRDGRAMIPFLLRELAFIEPVVVFDEKEALLLENTLIKKHQPKYNALLKDDKTFISLAINHKHPWPMLKLIRHKGRPSEDQLYFGPYPSAHAARETLDLLRRLFPLRQCSDAELKRRKRACLLYDIGRCIAPCVKKCTPQQYALYVEGATRFLKGKDEELLSRLRQQMEEASSKLEFEKAAEILATLKRVEEVFYHRSSVVSLKIPDCDVFGWKSLHGEVALCQLLYREGKLIGSEPYLFPRYAGDPEELLGSLLLQIYQKPEELPPLILLPIQLSEAELLTEIWNEILKKKVEIAHPLVGQKRKLLALAEENAESVLTRGAAEEDRESHLLQLEELAHLTRFPSRIECFDTSHSHGTDFVASMVAFTEGRLDRKRRRLFHIKTAKPGDDYGALREVLERRLTRALAEDDLPDLILIDGGKGQLNVAIDLLQRLNIASVELIAITKEEGLHTKGMTRERLFLMGEAEAISLPPTSPLLFFLQRIRDEAHAAAISFHKKKRGARLVQSQLTEIPGIGPIKRTRLLKQFGSLKQIARASDQEILAVEGITKRDLAALRTHLKN